MTSIIDREYAVKGAETYLRLLQYVKRHWVPFALAIVSMLVFAATETAFAATMKFLLDGGFVEQDPVIIRVMPFVILGIFLIRAAAIFGSSYLMDWVGTTVVTEIRKEMFRKLLVLPTRDYDTVASGELISKLTYNTKRVAGAATDALKILVRDTFTVIGLLAWMFYVSWQLALLMFLVAPPIALLLRTVTKKFRRISRKIQQEMGDVTHVIGEAVDANREIKIFGAREYEVEQFDKTNQRVRHFNLKMSRTKALNVPLIQFMVAIVLALVIYLASVDGIVEAITVGSFVSFVSAILLMFAPIKRLTNVNAQIQTGIAAGESVFALLDRPGEEDTGTRTIERAKGDIRFEHVSFAYNPRQGNVLHDINLHIGANEVVALVGRSGSGKTTMANLVARFYDPVDGRIVLDGINLRDLTLDNLREQIAYVGQHVTLFNDTLANNIAYGKVGDVSREEVVAAARIANAAEFVDQLPEGYDTEIGENGVMLSGGQRQRIAIARALLKDAPILILDEATSALDTQSERWVQQGLERLLVNRTTLVIAHRLSTIENADRIAVMSGGRIIELGTHRELIRDDGAYAALHRMQFSEAAAEEV